MQRSVNIPKGATGDAGPESREWHSPTGRLGPPPAAGPGRARAVVEVGEVINNWQSTATHVFRTTALVTTAAAVSATDPQNPDRYPNIRIPESIIPLREDWAGPDQKQNSKYYAYIIELKHTFTDRLNGLVAYNGQFDETFRKQTWSSLSSFGVVEGRGVHIDPRAERGAEKC